MSRPSAFRPPHSGPLAFGTAFHYHAPPRVALARWVAQRSAAAGRISQPVHSGRYPIRFQNGPDSGFTCA
jgi:hypothetical protein